MVRTEVRWERTLGGLTAKRFDSAVTGTRIARVGRRAKWIVLELEERGRSAGAILVHLRMSGRLVVERAGVDPGPWARVSLTLRGPGRRERELRFLDVRKFGRMRFVREPAEALAGLGPEPLGEVFTVAWLRSALRGRRRALKPLLLDQEFVAGLGNIYVDESLFRAGLHPLRRSDRVPAGKVAALHAAVQSTLREAIEREGSSIDTFYRTPEGQPGGYQHLFRVYGRDGKPCTVCGRRIKKLVVGQRGTHICTRCQPAPR